MNPQHGLKLNLRLYGRPMRWSSWVTRSRQVSGAVFIDVETFDPSANIVTY